MVAAFPLGSPKVLLQGFVVRFCLIELTVFGARILSQKHWSIFESFVTQSVDFGFVDTKQSTPVCLFLSSHLISLHSSSLLS